MAAPQLQRPLTLTFPLSTLFGKRSSQAHVEPACWISAPLANMLAVHIDVSFVPTADVGGFATASLMRHRIPTSSLSGLVPELEPLVTNLSADFLQARWPSAVQTTGRSSSSGRRDHASRNTLDRAALPRLWHNPARHTQDWAWGPKRIGAGRKPRQLSARGSPPLCLEPKVA